MVVKWQRINQQGYLVSCLTGYLQRRPTALELHLRRVVTVVRESTSLFVGRSIKNDMVQCVRKVAVHLHKLLEVMSTSVCAGLNPFNFIRKNFCRSAFGKSLCTRISCWKWCPRASIQAWTRLILFANTFCRSAFGKSLCSYKRRWNWCP
jgi:hypothetical protein